MNAGYPCRTYIVYRHELFAQGLRNILSRESGVEIVGMENDLEQAAKGLRDLHPEVLLLEEAVGSEIAWSFLEAAADSRIVTFSLDHVYATVYDHYRMAATEPADLVTAIRRGVRAGDESQDAQAGPRGGLASTAEPLTPEAGNQPATVARASQPDSFRVRKERIKARRAART